MEKNLDVIVIGAGAAGLTAGIYLKRSNLKTLVVEKYAPGGILLNIHRIDNYPGLPKVSGPDLAVNMMQQASDLGVEIAYEEARKIEKSDGGFLVYANDTYRAKAIIVASGMAGEKKKAPGEKELVGRGVSYCATCDGAFFKGKDVLLYGHDDRFAEEALYLAHLASSVALLLDGEPSWSEEHGEALKQCTNVLSLGQGKLLEVLGESAFEGIRYEQDGETKTRQADGFFPLREGNGSASYLYALGIEEERGFLKSDAEGKTNVPGVFVAGDAVAKKLRQVANAVGEAAVAATSAIAYVRSAK